MPFVKNTIQASLLLISVSTLASANTIINNADFQTCLDQLQSSKTFDSISTQTFATHRPIEGDATVLASLDYQPEFKKEPWEYLAALVDEQRVEDGIAKYAALQQHLLQMQAQYNVAATDILAVWGVESDYGRSLGKKDLFTSLGTLSCFGRRQSYFKQEFANALKIVQNGDVAAKDMKGSWAGAFGQTQFMPSTFLNLAQDYDGDGKKDLVNSELDALASTANFLKKSGYVTNQPWGYEVLLPKNGQFVSNRKNKKAISYWSNQGITLTDGSPLPSTLKNAGLLLPAGDTGPAFLVGKNFDSFYAYNASENYALAIAHLSYLIKKQETTHIGFTTPWPTEDPGISRLQAKYIQERLNELGYDVGNADGIIGDATRKAIIKMQNDNQLKADGKAGIKLYHYLTQANLNQSTNKQSKENDNQLSVISSEKKSTEDNTAKHFLIVLFAVATSFVLGFALAIIRKKTVKKTL